MIHWTDIEKSKEGILQILEVIKNYEKDGEVRFIAGIQGRHFSEYKIQQLICIVRERLNTSSTEEAVEKAMPFIKGAYSCIHCGYRYVRNDSADVDGSVRTR